MTELTIKQPPEKIIAKLRKELAQAKEEAEVAKSELGRQIQEKEKWKRKAYLHMERADKASATLKNSIMELGDTIKESKEDSLKRVTQEIKMGKLKKQVEIFRESLDKILERRKDEIPKDVRRRIMNELISLKKDLKEL